MTFEELATFHKIAWDFDKTLVDSKASHFLHSFIKEHPDIEHYIVTFRTHGMVEAMPYDLNKYKSAPDFSVFKNIFHIDEDAWMKNDICLINRNVGRLKGPLTEPEIYYKTWKGLVCSEHGIPILIDDDIPNTILGCEKYSIKLVDPLDLL